ncbi:MAG: twin arginine-targeting protein translocase TatC [Chloroflexi bacterium RBG_16_72_14]|nr:MAG: twin arginine-targeting protein translocase TatC [Chloroflexi bacterium RBG_16_72_14]
MADADAVRDVAIPARLNPTAEPAQPSTPAPSVTPPDAPPPAQPGEMSLVGHLTELRDRLIRIVLAIAVASSVGFILGDQIVAILKAPIPTDAPLYFTGLGDAFVIRLKIGIVVGIILAMPVILYQVWAFVAPGLTADERRVVRPWIPFALLFFAAGVGLAYVILPFAAAFLIGFSTADLQPLITAGAYFDFVTTMFLAFGLIMEFPIVLYGMSRVGIVTSERLVRSRRMAVLAIAIFAAAMTPGGDIISPLALGGTMYLLFEATIFAIRRSGK